MAQSDRESSGEPQGNQLTAIVHNAKSEVEAVAIEAMLAEHGISVMVRRFWDSAYDGIFVGGRGWGNICVFAEDKERAADLVARYVASWEDKGDDT